MFRAKLPAFHRHRLRQFANRRFKRSVSSRYGRRTASRATARNHFHTSPMRAQPPILLQDPLASMNFFMAVRAREHACARSQLPMWDWALSGRGSQRILHVPAICILGWLVVSSFMSWPFGTLNPLQSHGTACGTWGTRKFECCS